MRLHPIGLATACTFLTLMNPSASANTKVPPGKKLCPGEAIASKNGRATLKMMPDGHLRLMWKRESGGQIVAWSSASSIPRSQAAWQNDGNLVVYGPDAKPVWATGTDKHPGSVLNVQDDGNLVIRSKQGGVLWASGSKDPEKRPLVMQASKGRMELSIKVSRTGFVEANRSATIKKQSGSYHHAFWFAILDDHDNTLWVSPLQTLTIGAKVGSSLSNAGRPVDAHKDELSHYQIPASVTKKACRAVVFMKQIGPGGSPVDRLEKAIKQFKRVDDAYKTMKESEIVQDSAKAIAVAAA